MSKGKQFISCVTPASNRAVPSGAKVLGSRLYFVRSDNSAHICRSIQLSSVEKGGLIFFPSELVISSLQLTFSIPLVDRLAYEILEQFRVVNHNSLAGDLTQSAGRKECPSRHYDSLNRFVLQFQLER